MQNPSANVWLVSRAAVLLLGAFGANSFVPGPQSPFAGGSVTLLLVFFGFGVIAMVFVVGLQAINPRSAAVWTKPDWHVNSFSLRQPLQFFHLIGFFFIVTGLAAAVVTLLKHLAGLEPLLPIALGAGTLLGVRCCMVLYSTVGSSVPYEAEASPGSNTLFSRSLGS
jgi:hypothetical protein